jgi:hypothetical protein
MMMKRILLEFIMVIALIILSGIVLADDFLSKSDNELLGMKEQIQKMHTGTGMYAYRIKLKNKMRNIDDFNQMYREHDSNQLVNDNQYYYAQGSIERYGIISL